MKLSGQLRQEVERGMQCWWWVRPAMLRYHQLCRKTCHRVSHCSRPALPEPTAPSLSQEPQPCRPESRHLLGSTFAYHTGS